MLSHKERKLLPYKAEDLFSLVGDIEKYPEFLPWITHAKILKRQKNKLYAELEIKFAGMSERYISDVMLKPATKTKDYFEIFVKHAEGPFSHLENYWRFEIIDNESTVIDFEISFEFNSLILEKLIGLMFDHAARKMVEHFEKRAEELYA